MGSILNTAISGINAMKMMIENTVNKMNHPVEDNKETRVFTENTGQNSHSNTITKVKEIYNSYNDFIIEEKRKTNEKVQDEQTKIEQLSKLEDLLCMKSNIFNKIIHDLYEATQTYKDLNEQNTVNEQFKEKLNNVVLELKDFDRKLKFLETDIKDAVIYNIKKVNTLIDEIHDTTINIRYHPILKTSGTVEDLIQKRDDLVDELNGLIGIKVVKNNDSYKLYLNNGICIIDDNEKQNLIPLTSTRDERYISVGYIDNDQKILRKIEDMIPSATIGALLNFRKEELTSAKNKIGQFTVNLANGINSNSILGYDIFKNIGKQLFNISDPEVISSSTNHSSPTTSSKWVSMSDAQDTDYIIYFKNNNWTVTKLSDYTKVQTDMHRIDNNGLMMNFDGIEFSIHGESADGDIYMVKPYSKTLEKLDLLIDQNDPLVFSSINKQNNQDIKQPITIQEFNQNFLVNHKSTIDESYQKFSRFISYKCNALEEEVPFKRNMVEILRNKKISMPKDVEKNYQDLNYEQECYLANVHVLKIAESIFNEIIDCYS